MCNIRDLGLTHLGRVGEGLGRVAGGEPHESHHKDDQERCREGRSTQWEHVIYKCQ